MVLRLIRVRAKQNWQFIIQIGWENMKIYHCYEHPLHLSDTRVEIVRIRMSMYIASTLESVSTLHLHYNVSA